MKKAITILAIIAIVVGSIFAANQTENHSIKLQTVIDPVVPAFQLTNSSVTGNNSDGSTTGIGTQQWTNKPAAPATPASFVNNGNHTYTAESRDAVLVGDISRYNVSAVFDVLLVNKAKEKKSYTVTLSAGSFNTKVNGAANATAPASHAVSGLGTKQGVTTSGSGDSFTAAFNGTTCNQETDSTTLAQYTVTYDKRAEIDPGTYTADITMEITTTV